MNIKGLVGNLAAIATIKPATERKVQTGETADREPQKEGSNGSTPERHEFTDDELKELLEIIQGLPGFKANNLRYQIKKSEKQLAIFIVDPTNKVIRRLSEVDLWGLYKSHKTSKKGNLLDKSL